MSKSTTPPARWQLLSEFQELSLSQQAEVRRQAQNLLLTHTKSAAWDVAMSRVRKMIFEGETF